MSLNYKEIAQILKELDLNGAQFQKIRAVDYESFSLTFYKPGNPINIFIDLKQNCTIFRTTSKTSYLKNSHNLVEFIKAYLINGKVINTSQLNNNRIINIEILNEDMTYYLLIRLWGGFSNIVITDTNYKILHLHKKSSKKQELPGQTFNVPSMREDKKEYQIADHNEVSYNTYIEKVYKNKINNEKVKKEYEEQELLKNRRIKELQKQLTILNKTLKTYMDKDKYKLYGELILANIHMIKNGDCNIEVFNYNNETNIIIPLDPKLKPHENSNIYFKKFKKAEKGLSITEERITEIKEEITALESGRIGPKTREKQSATGEKQQIGLRYNNKKWEFLVGRSAKENEELLRHYVKGNDMWLHIRDYPGSYVFIKNKKGKTIPLEILICAGNLALYYSKGKSNGKGDIYYTQVKYLKKIKNGKPGQVIPTRSKNLFVKLDKEILKSLKA